MTITVNNTFFPDSIASQMTRVRKRLTFVKPAETAFEPFRRPIQPQTISVWTLQSAPINHIQYEALANDLKTIRDLWEAHLGRTHNFKFRPPVNRTVLSGDGFISGGVYYIRHKSYAPDGTTVIKSRDHPVLPDTVTTGGGGTTWFGTYCVAARFDMDELEEEVQAGDDTIIMPSIQISELVLA